MMFLAHVSASLPRLTCDPVPAGSPLRLPEELHQLHVVAEGEEAALVLFAGAVPPAERLDEALEGRVALELKQLSPRS